jgi:ATP-dependent RNA helicase RhlE
VIVRLIEPGQREICAIAKKGFLCHAGRQYTNPLERAPVHAPALFELEKIMSQFLELGLSKSLVAALTSKGYDTPTPIQTQSIPPLLKGRDLCGIAQTGTGKTAAFALPSLQRLHADPKHPKPLQCRMLVLSPTRELAAQIAQSFRDYAKSSAKTRVEVVFGGVPINRQIRALSQGVDVLVATPGRLVDLMDQRALSLKNVEIFVLDEADQMLDLGFIHALKHIVKFLPAERQSLFFSATMPKSIADLGAQFLKDPVRVSVTPAATTAERVQQYATFVNHNEKQALLTMMLQDEPIDRALVFTRTKHGADRVVRNLAAAGVESAAIHGNKSQAQRTTALQAFRHGHIKILVATDIAARGIDVSGVSHVFNYEMPNVPEQYVHRIGRTARAGREGIAISLIDAEERGWLRGIERLTRVQLEQRPLPADFAARAAKLPKAAAKAPRPDAPQRRGGPARGRPEGARAESRYDNRPDYRRDPRSDGRPARTEGRADARPARDNTSNDTRPDGNRQFRGGGHKPKGVGTHKHAIRKTGRNAG